MMNNPLYERFFRYAFIRAAILAVMAVLTLVFPALLQNGMVYVIAGYVVLVGALGIFDAVRHPERGKSGIHYGCVALSGILIVFGILAIGYYRYLVGFLPLFLGGVMMAEGVLYFVAALCSKAAIKPLLIILSVFIFSGGMATIIFSFGFGGLTALSRITGVLLLLSGAYELTVCLLRFFSYSLQQRKGQKCQLSGQKETRRKQSSLRRAQM